MRPIDLVNSLSIQNPQVFSAIAVASIKSDLKRLYSLSILNTPLKFGSIKHWCCLKNLAILLYDSLIDSLVDKSKKACLKNYLYWLMSIFASTYSANY